MKTNRFKLLAVAISLILVSCKDYLDVVPDNIPTIDHAFVNRNEAERFLFGCFGFMPDIGNVHQDPALTAGDEVWFNEPLLDFTPDLHKIFKGEQGATNPLANYFSSKHDGNARGGKNLFTGLRDINIFLENINKPYDLSDFEKKLWIAEAKFMKAYFHFWLLQMYGPIPIIRENLPIDSAPEITKIYRDPIDEVVDYIVSLLNECAEDLPLRIEDEINDMGRPTKPIALALKAKVLTLAASPLFNGNTDYTNVVDNRGVQLFPQEYSTEKWIRAAEALKEVIYIAHEAGHELYDYNNSLYARFLDSSTIMAMQVRGAVVERWNPEIIWGNSRTSSNGLQRLSYPTISQATDDMLPTYAPPLNIVEQFYSSNGVPIEEDKNWQGIDWYGIKRGDEKHKYYIRENYETINLHFNREARFYGSIIFDGMRFYGQGRHADDENLFTIYLKFNNLPGGFYRSRHGITGYLSNKLIHYLTSSASGNINTYSYAFPIIRLADLYLLYAEALNEIKDVPDFEVYEFIDLVRNRTGLKGVVESWGEYSIEPDKPLSKEGMRDIIRRERLNELAFEGGRFWDLRRWKLSEQFYNKPIRALNVYGSGTDFYNVVTIFQPKYEKKDYLWPIRWSNIYINPNLLQNPGWK